MVFCIRLWLGFVFVVTPGVDEEGGTLRSSFTFHIHHRHDIISLWMNIEHHADSLQINLQIVMKLKL